MASTNTSKSTRTSAGVWLIGKSTESLSHVRLPSKGDVLKKFHYHHLEQKMTVKQSIRNAVVGVMEIWEKARIPSQRIDSVERKLNKLVGEYLLLKKNRKTNLESCRMKENIFKADLVEIFDIAVKDALTIMKNKEDKTFLIMQREDNMSCSMAGVDNYLKNKENRKRKRDAEAETRRLLNIQKQKANQEVVDTLSEIMDSDDFGENSSNTSSCDEYQAPSTSTCKAKAKPSLQKSVFTKDVIASIDRVNLTDRNAVFVFGSVAQALGIPIADISLSRSTIRRKRNQNRKNLVESDQASFISQCHCPLILHWDGKLLSNIIGGVQKVDRVAIIVSGGGLEKLIGVPEIKRGTGEQQANACLQLLDDWCLKGHIRALCFDTTASNTGLNLGACTLIEKALDKELIWIACRHHIFEVMLSNVFKEVFGSCGGPDVQLFKRFQKQWSKIDKKKFIVGDGSLFSTNNLIELLQEMQNYYAEAIKSQQPRDDYLELLTLCQTFLGCSEKTEVKFRAPGALHQARWMAKAIYCLKIYLFQNQFVLTAAEKKGVTDISVFVSLIYGRYWNEAPIAEKAPLNDANLLQLIDSYPNKNIRTAASEAFRRHLWYFSEYLIGLAFFDSRVTVESKREMVKNLMLPPKAKALKRLDGKTFNHQSPIESFVTQRTTIFFDLLVNEGREKAASFLTKDPTEWKDDAIFIEMGEKVRQLKVVNDCAERGIALIQKFNNSITKNEQQKQYLLRLVDLHKKKFPTASKANVMKMNLSE